MCVDLKVCVQLQPGVQLCSLGDWWCWAPPPAEGPPVIQDCSPGRCRLIGPFSSKSIYLSLNSGHFLKVVPSFVLFYVLAWSSHVQPCCVASGFLFNQAAAHQTWLIQSTGLSLQKVDWSNCVLLTGWNKNLQPHGPLWNSLDMPGIEGDGDPNIKLKVTRCRTSNSIFPGNWVLKVLCSYKV